jgi:hypothetical protein
MTTSATEAEILKATRIKATTHKLRQDHLAALVRGIDKLKQDDWDNLSDAAVEWHTAAVAKMDKKHEIADFPDLKEIVDATTETEDTDTDAEPENIIADFPDIERVPEDEPEQETEEKPAKKTKAKKEKKVVVREFKESLSNDEVPVKQGPERYDNISGDKDRFGITIGTKTHDAVKMYNRPDGATLKQVDEAIGGRHYNILTRLTKDGHKVEKRGGGVWKVTHRDNV